MRIVLAGDSVGVVLSEVLAKNLESAGFEVKELSRSPTGEGEYYANIAERVARAILAGEFDRGILCCGTGIGMAISANKVPGIRAAQTHDTFSAERARQEQRRPHHHPGRPGRRDRTGQDHRQPSGWLPNSTRPAPPLPTSLPSARSTANTANNPESNMRKMMAGTGWKMNNSVALTMTDTRPH